MIRDNEAYWRKCLQNADEHLGWGSKKLWLEIEPLIIDLFYELKRNDKLEIVFPQIASKHLVNVVQNRNQIMLSYNIFSKITNSIDSLERFTKNASEFGFDENNTVHMLVQYTALSIITDTECFKTFLLFQLKDVDHRVANFNRTIAYHAPKTWGKLQPLLYNKFRNALAHGTWTIERNHIVLFEDAKLVPFEKMHIAVFIVKSHEQSILTECLLSVIQDLIDSKFFE